MKRYTFQFGNGSTMTIDAKTVEEAIAKLFPKAGSFLGYYELQLFTLTGYRKPT
jgi:hypothetical protein